MINRVFIPGSNWVYLKIYLGENMADKVLSYEIYSLIKTLKNRHLIIKWFFIRYSDPAFHLRIRFLIDNSYSFGEVMYILNLKMKNLVKKKAIWKVQFDTYNREIERYNKIVIEDVETLFYLDSDCILSIIKSISKMDENFRWMISLNLVDNLLSNFHYSLTKKMDIMSEIYDSFRLEFKLDNDSIKQLNSLYRRHKYIIESVLDYSCSDKQFLYLYKITKVSSCKMLPVINLICDKLKNKNEINLAIKSYLHMTLNRIFISNNRLYELIISAFMKKYYQSKISRLENK